MVLELRPTVVRIPTEVGRIFREKAYALVPWTMDTYHIARKDEAVVREELVAAGWAEQDRYYWVEYTPPAWQPLPDEAYTEQIASFEDAYANRDEVFSL